MENLPDFRKGNGLVPIVVQDKDNGEILMLAYTDEKGLMETLECGKAVFYSRSRQKRWKKGETSGNYQIIHSVFMDCDGDALIYKVEQKGNACHTGNRSCFYRSIK